MYRMRSICVVKKGVAVPVSQPTSRAAGAVWQPQITERPRTTTGSAKPA